MRAPQDIYDPAFVKGVFDRCSARYIGMSYVFSFGFVEVWPHLLRRFPRTRAITAVDISSGMHQRALERLHQHRAHKIAFIEDDVLASNLADESADFVVSTFGLKTFNAEQHGQLARLIARVLKPGGAFSLIEASDPHGWSLRGLYRLHMDVVLPLVERNLLKGAQDFAMIGQYTKNFRDASAFSAMLEAEGLDATYRPYFFGCASGVSGRKPL
jgi:ubiquinone/menaquinone biosynthesis C-methylase UbiE